VHISYIFCLSQTVSLIFATTESFRREINRLAHKSFETVGNMLNFECQVPFAPFCVVFIRTFTESAGIDCQSWRLPQPYPITRGEVSSIFFMFTMRRSVHSSERWVGLWTRRTTGVTLQFAYFDAVLWLNSEWSCSSCHLRKRAKIFPWFSSIL